MGSGGSRVGWTLFAVLGIAAWLGFTFYAGATNDDPSDPAPTARAFALGGAVFTAALLGRWALHVRSAWKSTNESLYRKLAIRPVRDEVLGAALRTRSHTYVYLLFTAVMGGLVFAAIGLGTEGPQRELIYAALGVAGLCGVYLTYAMRTAFRAGAAWLEPLGLVVSETPKWIPRPMILGGLEEELDEAFAFTGRRHGRDVAISQMPSAALTLIRGSFAKRAVDGPQEIASVAGEPAGSWRRVQVEAGPDGVIVLRRANGAGRHMLQDLWLAERVADGS